MHPCHHGANQHWYFDGELLKNRYDNKCVSADWWSALAFLGQPEVNYEQDIEVICSF